jgi:hypothetical protein
MASAIIVHVDQERLKNMSRRHARLEAWNTIAAVKAATQKRDKELERRSLQAVKKKPRGRVVGEREKRTGGLQKGQ